MPKKSILKGWVECDQKPMAQKTYAADMTSGPTRVRRAADAARRAAAPKKSKLRGVFLRPESGTDANAKLVLVDKKNKPKYAQG
jgi:hypothetical protein